MQFTVIATDSLYHCWLTIWLLNCANECDYVSLCTYITNWFPVKHIYNLCVGKFNSSIYRFSVLNVFHMFFVQ